VGSTGACSACLPCEDSFSCPWHRQLGSNTVLLLSLARGVAIAKRLLTDWLGMLRDLAWD
jgi:hypothetical protein